MANRRWAEVAILGAATTVWGCGEGRAIDVEASGGLTQQQASLRIGGTAGFFIPPPPDAAVQQIARLVKARDFHDALSLAAMVATPQAVWLVGGSPDDVRTTVRKTMARAANEHRVPVLVAYNVPFRDCGQYSAGGALDTAAYDAWIDGFAAGVGDGRAVVILEPDGLGIIPYNTTMGGTAEWCKPTVSDAAGNPIPAPGSAAADRYAQLNYAVDSLRSKAPNAAIYLDGTHSAWLPAGEAAFRLDRAGVRRASGFFLNVSNFQPTPQLIQYGTWISKCLYYASNPAEGGWRVGHYDYCGSQYNPASPDDVTTWGLTDQWYADNVDNAVNPPSGPSALSHIVIDTSRNGRGAFAAAPYAAAPYNQPAGVIAGLAAGGWCNPPGAGAGLPPTAETGVPLVDANLWIKTPGESDGSCDLAGGARAWDYSLYNPWGLTGDVQQHFDPLWGAVDPQAGAWFEAQALQLAQNANPCLLRR